MNDDVSRSDGQFTFEANLNNVTWTAFTVMLIEVPFTSANLVGADNGTALTIEINFEGIHAVDELQATAQAIAKRMVNRLAFLLDSPISDPVCTGGYATSVQADGNIIHLVGTGSINITGGLVSVLHTYNDSDARFRPTLERTRVRGEAQFELYRSLLAVQDVVVRFMALYLALMFYHQDKQHLVAAFIIAHEPGVAQTSRPDVPARMETVYSRLRNQIGHNRGVTLSQTRHEIETHVHGLQQILKKCLEQKAT